MDNGQAEREFDQSIPCYDRMLADGQRGEMKQYRKRVLTLAKRMDGPFSVQTTEGLMTCRDGWLAIDSRGEPYPIADEEFREIYEEATQ